MRPPRLVALPSLAGHTRRVSSVATTADGQRILSGSLDRSLRLWGVAGGACEKVLQGHTSDVNAVALSPGGKLAISGSGEITSARTSRGCGTWRRGSAARCSKGTRTW